MSERHTKIRRRILQACEPCRRKKGRCTGERPVCSLCARLGQTCTYATSGRGSQSFNAPIDTQIRSLSNTELTDPSGQLEPQAHYAPSERRNSTTDKKLDEILYHVRKMSDNAGAAENIATVTNIHNGYRETSDFNRLPNQGNNLASNNVPNDMSSGANQFELPSARDTEKAANIFLRHCHCQPLPLFCSEGFASSLSKRDPELIFCVSALALRFESGHRTRQSSEMTIKHYVEAARSRVINSIFRSRVELSTLQSLCMLALLGHHDGNWQLANVSVTLAVALSRGANLESFAASSTSTASEEEHVRTLWSIVMLQYLTGSFGIMSISVDITSCRFPKSDGINTFASDIEQPNQDHGIVAYVLQMTEAWYKVRQWVQHRGKLDLYPPWSQKSQYSSILFRQMDLESQMPQKHRFKPSGFAEQSVNVLATNRIYWAPWLYLQIIYHAVVCTLNHPILLSIHLRRFKVNQVPEIFLQQTADMISSHTDWLIHLLEIAKEKGFEFSDPFLGPCVAIVATIFLQQSYTQEQVVRSDKQAKFSMCMEFVENLGSMWPSSKRLVRELTTLEATVSQAYEMSSSQNTPNLAKNVDLTSFWNIIDFTSSVPSNAGSIFGTTLVPRGRKGTDADVLSTTLLPEPTRVRSLPHNSLSTSSTPFTSINDPIGSHAGFAGLGAGNSLYPQMQNDFTFSAQDYFALGQDFVGNADDWFACNGT